jgi:type IV secretory pathway TrbL component
MRYYKQSFTLIIGFLKHIRHVIHSVSGLFHGFSAFHHQMLAASFVRNGHSYASRSD